MNIQFLQRELKRDELDKQGIELTGAYLITVCLQAPRAWAQFKAIVAKAEELAEQESIGEGIEHTKDSDCTLDEDDCCIECGVDHGDPCRGCGGRGFHNEPCPLWV